MFNFLFVILSFIVIPIALYRATKMTGVTQGPVLVLKILSGAVFVTYFVYVAVEDYLVPASGEYFAPGMGQALMTILILAFVVSAIANFFAVGLAD